MFVIGKTQKISSSKIFWS